MGYHSCVAPHLWADQNLSMQFQNSFCFNVSLITNNWLVVPLYITLCCDTELAVADSVRSYRRSVRWWRREMPTGHTSTNTQALTPKTSPAQSVYDSPGAKWSVDHWTLQNSSLLSCLSSNILKSVFTCAFVSSHADLTLNSTFDTDKFLQVNTFFNVWKGRFYCAAAILYTGCVYGAWCTKCTRIWCMLRVYAFNVYDHICHNYIF